MVLGLLPLRVVTLYNDCVSVVGAVQVTMASVVSAPGSQP